MGSGEGVISGAGEGVISGVRGRGYKWDQGEGL